ncbi:MAG: AI-2E family transporter [Chloroflexia bacterium]
MESLRFSTRAKVITIWVVLILAILLLWRVLDVATPFFWAILVAYVLHPLIKWLNRTTRVPRFIWIILLYLAVGSLIYWGVTFLVPVVARQYEGLLWTSQDIVATIQDYIARQKELVILGIHIDLQAFGEQAVEWLTGLVRSLPGQALAGVSLVVGTVLHIIVFLVATFHCLLFGERWVQSLLELVPPPLREELTTLLQRIHLAFSAYLRAQLVRIALVSIVLGIGLSILQVRFAVVLALFSGLMDIIPLIGPFISGGVTVLVTLFQPEIPFGWSHLTLALVVVALYVGLNQLEENIVLPPIIGYIVDLPPLLVLFAVLAGGSIGGVLGLFLAVPFAAALKIVLRYLYAKLMDRPVAFEEMVRRSRRIREKKKGAQKP